METERMETERSALKKRIADLIADPETSKRDRLLDDLGTFQAKYVRAYGRLVKARGAGVALPTDVFRHTRVASYPPSKDVRSFRTSGTTVTARGTHAFRDLELYDLAARTWAQQMLFPLAPMRLVVLAPSEVDAPDSSLSYMLARFGEWFGPTYSCWPIRRSVLQRLVDTDEPTMLLGTSFGFVHAEETLGALRFQLPQGSKIMQTGGFKGRTREVDKHEMLGLLSARYGVPESHVLGEYGMTELSSQAYETTEGTRRYRFGPWVRTQIVDPVTLQPTDGVGLLRIDDPANLDSVGKIQTADLARQIEDGFELLGRPKGAMPRGCSLAVEEALG